MKTHYQTEAEWMADFNAMMARRRNAVEQNSAQPKKPRVSVVPNSGPQKNLVHGTPGKITRTS